MNKKAGYDVILLMAGLPLLVNFKIENIGGVYFSFLFEITIFFTLLLRLFFNDTQKKLSLIVLASAVIIILHSWLLRLTGFSTSVNFEFAEALPIGHYLKTLLFGMVFYFYYNEFKKRKLNIYEYIKSYRFIIFLAVIKYWILYGEKIMLTRSDNLDAGRAYPEWLGGWNSWAMLISFEIIFKTYEIKKKNIVDFVWIAVLWITILSTQSRGGLWFLVIAILLVKLLSPKTKISEKVNISKMTLIYFSGVLVVVGLLIVQGDALLARFLTSFGGSNNSEVEIFQSVTSGRSVQWLDIALKFMAEESVFQYLLGYGIGHYAWSAADEVEIEVHNMYLQMIYDFGILFGFLGCYILIKIFLKIKFMNVVNSELRIAKALSIIILLTAVVQGIVFSTQTGWIVASMVALIASISNGNKFGNFRTSYEVKND